MAEKPPITENPDREFNQMLFASLSRLALSSGADYRFPEDRHPFNRRVDIVHGADPSVGFSVIYAVKKTIQKLEPGTQQLDMAFPFVLYHEWDFRAITEVQTPQGSLPDFFIGADEKIYWCYTQRVINTRGVGKRIEGIRSLTDTSRNILERYREFQVRNTAPKVDLIPDTSQFKISDFQLGDHTNIYISLTELDRQTFEVRNIPF